MRQQNFRDINNPVIKAFYPLYFRFKPVLPPNPFPSPTVYHRECLYVSMCSSMCNLQSSAKVERQLPSAFAHTSHILFRIAVEVWVTRMWGGYRAGKA